MTSPGWGAAIGCAVLLLLINSVFLMIVSQAAHGTRNHLMGIRLPALMKSDDAWRAGHVAAKKPMLPVLVVAMALALVSIPMQLVPVAYVVLIIVSLAFTILSLVVGSITAIRAARATVAPGTA